jgi:hypothetical protein
MALDPRVTPEGLIITGDAYVALAHYLAAVHEWIGDAHSCLCARGVVDARDCQ